MKNFLINATKKRVISEIRDILYRHPRYREDSNNVQNKYSFEERPSRGVIVDGSSADRVKLSADNYMGRVSSFVMQAPVQNYPGTTIEWVKENQGYLEEFSRKRDVFPSPPGVYIIKITGLPDDARGIPGTFIIDPLLTVTNEPLIQFTTTSDSEGQLSRTNIYSRSVRLWMDGRVPLIDGVDYTVDYESGLVTFLKPTPVNSVVYADYRYEVESQGPFEFKRETVNLTAIPGAVIAFGDRTSECDQIAVVVTEDRTDVYDVYGGKFEVGFDLLVFSKDSEDREKLSDYLTISILEKQNSWGFEGLELLDISPGGESEEVYNAEIDDYYYDGSVSLSMRVDWEIHAPLPVEVYRADFVSRSEEQQKGYMDGTYTLDQLNAISDPIELVGVSTVIGRDIGYERIL